jgi:hypothetical protein
MSVSPIPHFEPSWSVSRAPLTELVHDLGKTLIGPADQESWPVHLGALLRPLREAFAEHRAATEGDAGLYAEVLVDAPRLANTVGGLVAEHRVIDTAIQRLAAVADEITVDAEALRRGALEVLDELAQHRQRDSDLVYEAYTTDIGGE